MQYICLFVEYIFVFPLSKHKSTNLFSPIGSLLCNNLLYEVVNSKAEMEFAFLPLLSLFIASITVLYLPCIKIWIKGTSNM